MTDEITTSPAIAPPWLMHAWSEFGVTEQAGAASNDRIVEYSRSLGHTEVTADDVPWCAAFVGACLEHAGIGSTRSLRARSYTDWGEPASSPPPLGAIAVFSRGSDPNAGHVGFCLADLGTSLVILGGNQSDAVTVEFMPRSRLIALRWPVATSAKDSPIPNSGTSSPESLFDRCLAHILEVEGGFGDDPYDPGGPTNLGITLATLAAWRDVPLNDATRPALVADLRALTPDQAAPIYVSRYWHPSKADHLPAPLALMHFDAAVNHGVTGAARLLQSALDVEVDGEIGPITLAAVNEGSALAHLSAYASARRARYRSLPHFWRFGRGWLARVDATLALARQLPLPPPSPKSNRKENPMSTSEVEPKWWGHSLTIWGTIVTTLATVLPAIGPLFGLDVTAELVRQFGAAVAQSIEAIGGVIGIVLTILGRMRAVQPLARRPFSVKL